MPTTMPLTSIHIELAAESRETSDQAKRILNHFRRVDTDGYPFNVGSNPTILGVGYVGDIAVTAATCNENAMTAPSAKNEAKAPFVGLPSLDVYLIATEERHRRNGFGTQLVGSIINLAMIHNFDRVEAKQPSDEEARYFWGACGFKSLPFANFGEHDMYKSTRGLPLEKMGVELVVSPEVNERLANFTQAQIIS
jgi:GNAT superfamily N-acetyltransferase